MCNLRIVCTIHQTNFILLTETWCSQKISDMHLTDRVTSRGGGCIIFTLETLHSDNVENIQLSAFPESLRIFLCSMEFSLLIGCIHRSPNAESIFIGISIKVIVFASRWSDSLKILAGYFNMKSSN